MEKLTVIKVGGKIVEEEATLAQLLDGFSKIEGRKVLVHGGGRSATAMATRLGIESKMVNGRRITDEETLKVVTMVYAGLVNKNIVARLQSMDVNALGLTGADLNYMKDMATYSRNQNFNDAKRLSDLFKSVYFCNKAVIADVHGACIGGGNGIAAAADIVIAETNTKFAFSEVKLGITPATISPFVVQKIGNAAARELMLTGRRFSALEAKECKLVNAVAEQPELIDVERRYVEHFLQASPVAVAECKNLLRMVSGFSNPYDAIFGRTSEIIAEQRISEAGQEGMNAFFEKRKPNWQ